MTAHKGNICFVSQESQFIPRQSRGKHQDLRETRQMLPEGPVIKCFVILYSIKKINHNY